jgi:hypothetical protein
MYTTGCSQQPVVIYIKQYIMRTCIILCLLIMGGALSALSQQQAAPVTVVELFTSEGCSSCPAADELLAEMSQLLTNEGKPVIALAFHVTYWDRLGWKDIYSQEIFTQRQKNYLPIFQLEYGYTPQAIANGTREFVGSNPVGFRDAVTNCATSENEYTFTASAALLNDSIQVSYTLNKKPKKEWLHLAVVERSAVRTILKGENKNRTLRHYQVVRVFASHEIQESGIISLLKPKDLPVDNAAVVLYVQHKRSLKISGAAQIDIKTQSP